MLHRLIFKRFPRIMRFSGRDKRIRKTSRLPTFRLQTEYDPETTQQYFQVSVNVIEARQLAWANPQTTNSFVVAILGRKKQRTTLRKNMEEPVYREYLVFDLHTSIEDIQRSCLWVSVMEPRCYSPPRTIGEATIDLGTVWVQPNHQIYHKWAQLNPPRDTGTSGTVGFLKVDISIVLRGEMRLIPSIASNEKTEDNLLMMEPGFEQQKANYVVTVYAAFGLPSSMTSNADRRFGKPPSTYVRISFCGLVGKSSVQHRTSDPRYNEQISIVEMFPNMNPTLRFEVCLAEGYFNKVLASTCLHLGQISYDGENGFLPTFGPSLLHMYGPTSGSMTVGVASCDDGPFHKGALLTSVRTVVPYYETALKGVSTEPVSGVDPDSLWVQEDFCVYCPIFEISMLDRKLIGAFSGIAITMGEIPTDKKPDPEFFVLTNELKNHKLYYTGSLDVIKTKETGCIEFPSEYPVLQLATRQPDFRFRMYRNNIVYGIVASLEKSIADVKKRLHQIDYSSPTELIEDLTKAIDDTAANILKYHDIVQYSSNAMNCEEPLEKYTSDLDQKLMALQREELEKIYNRIIKKTKDDSLSNIFQQSSRIGTKESLIGSRKGAKYMLAEVKNLAQSIKSTIYKSVDGWPDITAWLLNERGSRVAYMKLPAAEVIYSVIPEQCGRYCGAVQTVYLRPLKCSKHINTASCYCIAAKAELMFWMGMFRQRFAFNNYMPAGYRLKIKHFDMHIKSNPLMIECRAYIYRAKFISSCGINGNSAYNSFVRINALGNVRDSKMQHKSSLPIYNEVLKIQKLVNTSIERLQSCPPRVLIEIFDDNLSHKCELIGRLEIKPIVDDKIDCAPKLQWHDIFKGSQLTGQILMSVQFVQIPEKLLKTTLYSSVQESFNASHSKEINLLTDLHESLPKYLIPKSMSFKVDIYWWGLRDVNIIRKPCVVLEIDDLIIKSEIIIDKKINSNFPNGRTSEVFESPLTQDYSPTMNIRLFDSSTFGRTLFLGTNVIKKPAKYLTEWLTKDDRDASLKSVSIISTDFREVGGQMLYVKKSKSYLSTDLSSNYLLNQPSKWQQNTKRKKWSRLFRYKEPNEEEITLLPVYAKENDQIKVVKKMPQSTATNDWWMRFIRSEKQPYCEEERFYSDYITIYENELEFQPEFSKFKDWCSTLKFYSGKKTGIPEKDEHLQCGSIKAGIAIYRWPPPCNVVAVSLNGVELDKGYFDEHPNNDPSKYLVRVYIVKASMNKEYVGKSHPYVLVSCGKKQMGERKNYVANTPEPVFGKMYEFSCMFPDDYLLTVSLYDCDSMPPDELIGSSNIDLEDRVYSKHRASVGLSTEYTVKGPARWRDCVKPSAILEEICCRNHIEAPVFPDAYTVSLNGVDYKDSGIVNSSEKGFPTAVERKENICLSILHRWHTFPLCGYQLVPEHVETRSLYHPDKPGVERGKLLMWVDIFPLDPAYHIPAPYDITPKKMEQYQLRVIVWDVQSVIINNTEKKWKTVDLYVKAWIATAENTQQTDVHYHTMTGMGNFNWRMIFNFLFHPVERKIVNKENCPFTEYEEYLEPIVEVQLLENNEDEVLGSLSLNLNSMYRGAKSAQQCHLHDLETGKKINLFSMRSIRAWWPLKTGEFIMGTATTTGYIDMELTILPLDKAVLMPVGVGRGPPAPLPDPSRSQSSETLYAKYLNTIYECLSARTKEISLFFIIVALVWLLAYFFSWGSTSNESFEYFTKLDKKRQNNVQGILRPLYP